MENSNCFSGQQSRFGYPYPWPPFPYPFPFPDPFPPYLRAITPAFGEIHNELLTEVALAFPDKESDETAWNFIIRGTSSKLAMIGITGKGFISFKEANNISSNIKLKLDKYMQELVNEGRMTPFIKEQTDILFAMLKNNSSADAAVRLNAYTSRIAFRNDVSAEDKITLLGGAAIAQSSNYFWEYALRNSNDPYHKIAVELNNSGGLYKIKWADVAGFVVGAVVGGVTAGPGGAVTTGIALGTFASKAFGEDK